MKTDHTPGPWKAIEYSTPQAGKRQFYIDGPRNNVFLADVYDGNGSFPVTANARFIVQACNSFDDMLEALEEARDFINTLLVNTSTEATNLLTNHGEDVAGRANLAIAKARGENGGEK